MKHATLSSAAIATGIFFVSAVSVTSVDAHAQCVLEPTDTSVQIKEKLTRPDCSVLVTSAGTRIRIDGNQSTINIPASVNVIFEENSVWDISGGTTIIIGGTYEIAPHDLTTHFAGDGSITTADAYDASGCPVRSRTAYPEWFGARVNDNSDDSIAITKALQFGNDVRLSAGTYDTLYRIWLMRGTGLIPVADPAPAFGPDRSIQGGQKLSGAGTARTFIRQAAGAGLVRQVASGQPGSGLWQGVSLQDFIIGMASDCTSVADLTIDGSRLPDDLSSLSTFGPNYPLVNGIQIGSHLGWRPPEPQVKNVIISNVAIHRPASACISIQSDRGARDVLIENVTCNARSERFNTAGLTVEAFHPTYANRYENVTVRNSSFTGGMFVLYLGGIRNFTLEDSIVQTEPGSATAVVWYTGKSGHTVSGAIRRSKISNMYPGNHPTFGGDAFMNRFGGTIVLAGRGIRKDMENVFPYLRDTGSGLEIENTTIESTTYSPSNPTALLVPLIRDVVGMSTPVAISQVTFRGGSYGILAADPDDALAFGGLAIIDMPPGQSAVIRDFTADEIGNYDIRHSTFSIIASQFHDQAIAPVRLQDNSVNPTDAARDAQRIQHPAPSKPR